MKNTVDTFLKSKNKKKLTMLTAYDYTTAAIIARSGINSILIGDSLGMVIQGNENTLSVTVDEIIYHSKAIAKAAPNVLIVGDMPFMSYQTSVYDCLVNAGRIIKEGGAHCVKLEGGKTVANHVQKLTESAIPVMGHIGLTPQSVNAFGGFKVQGNSVERAEEIINDAIALENAGAFSIVLECIPEKLSEIITNTISIPTIGIGAGKYCDGQVLVYQDMLGMGSFSPKFVKQYGNIGLQMQQAFEHFVKEVEEGAFPENEHTFKIQDTVIEEIKKNWK